MGANQLTKLKLPNFELTHALHDIGVGTGGQGALAPTFCKANIKIARKVITHSLINHRINVHTVYTTPLA